MSVYTNPTTGLPYRGSILECTPQLVIPTEPDEIANMIYNYSYDWEVVLAFFTELARAKGVIFDSVSVSQEVRRLIGEEHA